MSDDVSTVLWPHHHYPGAGFLAEISEIGTQHSPEMNPISRNRKLLNTVRAKKQSL